MAERTVLLLGAGFSKAVHEAMPTLDELGNDCRSELIGAWGDSIPKQFDNGYFEIWLSRIAEDQPDLTEVENARNRALFLDVSQVISKVISQRQKVATAAYRNQDWLFDLIEKLHHRQSVVITLNYDNLIELAVKSFKSMNRQPLMNGLPSKMQEVTTDMLILYQPPYGGPPPTMGALHGPMLDTFELIKLHGSLDWWWAPEDQSGATLSRNPLVGGFGPLSNEKEGKRAQLMRQPGRVPFIVPPTATKSGFYRNPLIRSLWQRAAQALSDAEHLVVFGYSVPSTDLVIAEVLRERVSSHCKVTIVNPCAGEIVKRLKRLEVSGKCNDRIYDHLLTGPADFTKDF